MKKQVLFTLCVTAASAALLTGCARKGEIAAAQQDPTLLPAEEEVTEGSSEGVTIQPTEATPPAAEQTPPPPPAETTPRKVAPPPEQPEIYTVTKGDSISALSVRFGVRQPDILAMNPDLRKNPNNLKIGQKIKFPAGTDVSKKAKPRAPRPEPAAGSVTYTVKQGDVLGGIARRHGVTVADIQAANNLKGTNIWVGQKLTIPGAKKAPKDKGAKAKPQSKPQPAKAEPKPQPAPQPAPVAEEPQLGEEALPPPVEGEEPPALLPPPPGADAPEAFTTYITKEGEDLTTVSLKWGVSLQDLRAANDLSDTASNAVPAGTTLKIPNQD